METQPQITTRTLTLELDDPALPPVFLAQLTLLRDSLLINVGAGPPVAAPPFNIAQDFACGMPRPTGPSSATSLSRTSQSSSTSLSAKLSKRYGRQVFLSLDLSALTTAPGESTERALLPLEKALVRQLDSVVRGTAA